MTIATPELAVRPPVLPAVLSARAGAIPLQWICALAVLALAAFDLLLSPGHLAAALGDTDDATRLIQVRRFLAGASWFDLTIPSIGAPDALVSHWSRLIDLGLAILMRVFGLVLTPAAAETAARFVWPLLLYFPLLLVIATEAERRAGRLAAVLAIGLIATSITGAAEFAPGRIDHHSAMILGLVAGAIFLARSFEEPRFAWRAGVALGLGTAIGYESIVLTAAVLGLTGAASLVTNRHGEAISRASIAFAATVFVAWLATTAPSLWLHSSCDALSLNLVVLVGASAAGLAFTHARGRQWSQIQRLAVPAAFAAVGLVLYIVSEPACLRGPFGRQDSAIGPIWLANVVETQSLVWLAMKLPMQALVFIVTAALGLFAAWSLARERSDDGAWLLLSALTLATALATWQVKLLPYATLLAVLPLACAICRLQAVQSISQPLVRAIGFAVSSQFVLGMLIASAPVQLAAQNAEQSRWSATAHHCISTGNVTPLAGLPAGLVFADRDLGPFIAALTPHRVVVAPYHRLDKAILDADRMLFGSADATRRRLLDLGVSHVALCPGLTRAIARTVRSDSLHAMLAAGAMPSWLEPVKLAGGTTIKAWRVVR